MKFLLLAGVLLGLSQFIYAQDKLNKADSHNKLEGCVYADIIYQTGEKHRVQKSVTDPITHKMTMVDAEPETWQECVEDKNADKTTLPQFYWRTLPN